MLRPRLTVGILGALTAFAPLSIDMYLPAMPALQVDLHSSALWVQITLASFFVGFSVGQLFLGPITDRFGRRRPLLFGLLLYILASAGCALTPNITWLILARAAQGLGACTGVVIARALVRDLFPPEQTPHIFSQMMLIMGVAPILAPLIGANLLLLGSWRLLFAVLTGIGLMILAASWRLLPEGHQGDARHVLTFGATWQRYIAIWKGGTYRHLVWILAASYAGMFAYIAGAPFVFISGYHLSALHFAWIFGGNALGLILFSQLNRPLHRRFSTQTLLAVAIRLQAVAGLALLLLAVSGWGGFWALLIPLFFFVASIGWISPNASALAMATQEPAMAGRASALMGAMQFSTAAVAAMGVGLLQLPSAMPMTLVMASCALIAALGLWMSRIQAIPA